MKTSIDQRLCDLLGYAAMFMGLGADNERDDQKRAEYGKTYMAVFIDGSTPNGGKMAKAFVAEDAKAKGSEPCELPDGYSFQGCVLKSVVLSFFEPIAKDTPELRGDPKPGYFQYLFAFRNERDDESFHPRVGEDRIPPRGAAKMRVIKKADGSAPEEPAAS